MAGKRKFTASERASYERYDDRCETCTSPGACRSLNLDHGARCLIRRYENYRPVVSPQVQEAA